MSGDEVRIFEYFLLPGHIFLPREPALISAVLGSSVAVSVWDGRTEYGAMAHFLYPYTDRREEAKATYGNVAVRYLLRQFFQNGSRKEDLKAQILGGATNGMAECGETARENVRIARSVLHRFGVEVQSDDVGGSMGRKVVYNTLLNETVVYKVQRLRRGDWYPYLKEDGRD